MTHYLTRSINVLVLCLLPLLGSTATAAVIVTDHRMTAQDQPANCVAPLAKSNFSPTDARAQQWTLVSGAVVGDVVRWDFRQPNGSSYFQTDPVTLNFNGNVCFSAFINIAGTAAASLLGTWEVRVTYNGAPLITDTFTIRSDTVTVTDHRITGTAPGDNCAPPPIKTSFAPTDASVYQWTLVSGAKTGDRVRWEFVQPSGAVYATSSTLTLSGDGDRCFWVSIGIAGQPAASLLGTWQVRVIYNDVPLLSPPDTFTISQTACPTVSSVSPTSGAIGSSLTITGTNFTGVTSVKFSSNVQANFTVANATTITATVPTGAVTGPITISKAGCADVQSLSFTVLLRPVIEVTPASLNFGSVLTSARSSLPLRIRNIGNAPLAVSSITSSNLLFTVSPPFTSFSLLPGSSVSFNINFAPDSAGAKTATLSINSNDPARTRVDVPMTGTGIAPAIEVTPASLSFGELRVAQTRDLPLVIRNTGGATLNVNSITISNPEFALTQLLEKPSNAPRSLPFSIAPGLSVEVTVRFRPSFVASGVGAQSGVLSINSNDPTRPRVDVPLTGTGLGPLLSAPSSLSFGSLSVCSAVPNTAGLTVTNTGNATLTIASISTDNAAFALTPRPPIPLSIGPGASLTLGLSFYTRNTGTQTGRLLISSNAVNNPGLSIALSGVGTSSPPPAIGLLSVSRTTLSHGRVDTARPVTPFNPFGLADVIGFVFPGGPLPANSIAPGALPPPLIGGFPGLPAGAIASAPDPLRITLGGGVSNPIVVSAANIPSCFTLVVAEGVTAPDVTRWERIGSRFGSGNLYAAVSIPGTSIFAGMELVTEADFNAYTANSIIYEAPDFGLLVAPAGQNGGTATFQARARRIPADPQCQTQFSQPQSTQVEFSRTVRIEIDANRTIITRTGTGLDVTVTAQIFGNFDPALNTVVRWAYDGDTVDLVVDDPDLSAPGAPRVLTHTFHVPATDECKLAQITAVASSTGNMPPSFLPPINPFVVLGADSIGLFTFRSGGCTVEDTRSVLVRAPDSNCAGGTPVGWIKGIVTNAASGERITGATVSVTGTNLSAITGDDGTYELNNVPAGLQTLSAAADGFSSRQVQVNVVSGQIATQDISLFPLSGTISGVVLNAFDAQPIAGASVSVKGTNLSATTRSDGSYTFFNVPIGSQTVDASASGFNPEEAIVTVGADQTVFLDFFLTPILGRISGIVRNATTNQPIAGATVTVAAAGLSATTGGDGSYTLSNVPAGPQTLNASADGFNAASASVTVLGGQTVNQNFALMPLVGTVTGIVRNADSNDPITGATVTVVGAGISATTGSDGSYTLSNVPAGAQTVSASATGFRAAQATVNVVGNQSVAQDIALPPLTGTIKGRITNATTMQPIANAEVELLPFPLSFANSDVTGNYMMTGVPIGQQVILATAPGYYAKLAVVNVAADQTSTQDFALTPKVGIVTGVIFDSFSQPVVGATIAVAGTNVVTTSGVDGIYTLSGVQEGTRTLDVSATGLRSTQATVNVVGNETIYKDIYLEKPTGAVRGTVRNAANNQPIAGASILVGIPFGAVYYSAITDGNGNYQLNDIPAQGLTIYAGADGFNPSQATTTIVANQTTVQDFALTPVAGTTTGTITGTVKSTAAGNPPVAGATVAVAGTTLSTTTGADGSYTLSNVPSGPQTLNVSRTGFRSTTVPVTVTGGQTLTQNISLTPGAGIVTGTVRNAANGDALVGATITVTGTSLTTTSGAGGTYTLNDVPTGSQTLNASATGFIATSVQVNVTDGQTVTQNISLSPTLAVGEIRITLNWTKDGAGHPRDLDAHLAGPNPDSSSCFHVYYANKGSLTSAPFAQLEVDNIGLSGAPPLETIRIAKLAPGIYRFYVINFSEEDPDGLSRSRATVQIFGATSGPTSFTVPGGTGDTWTVFEINGQTGAITAINQLASPAGNCH